MLADYGCGEMTPTKKPHELFRINIEMFTEAIQWIRRELVKVGYDATEARLDPPLEVWHFYDHKGQHVFSCPHDVVDLVWDRLRNDGA